MATVDVTRILTNPMEHCVFKTNVKLFAEQGLMDITIIVSDVAIYLIELEKGGIYASHSLFELRSCQIVDGYVVMTFERDVHKLEGSEYASSFLAHITSQIIQCFLPSEYPKMPRPVQKLGYSVPFQQFFQRFRAKLRHRGKCLDLDVLQKVKEYAQTRPKIFDTDVISGMDEVLDVVLESLLIESSVTGIRINQDPYGDKWKKLALFVQKESSIVSVRSAMPLNEFFKLFMETWFSAPQASLSRLCIADTIVDSASISCFGPFIASGKMKCLAFENVIFGPEVDRKLRDELRKEQMKMKAISFSNMFLDRFPQIPTGIFFGIQAITLRGCNMEISVLMKMLTRSPQVTFCDFSGNLGLQPMAPEGKLPQALKKLILDHIEWRSEALVDLFRFSSTGEDHLLSVGNAKLTDSEWAQFFKVIPLVNPRQISALIWRGNPFRKGLAEYLLRASNLKYLSLAGCTYPQQINEVISVFEKHPSISVFDLHGCNGAKFNNLMLLQAIATNKVIERVDLSNNNLGMDAMQIVNAMIIAMKQNGEVILDGNPFCTTEGMEKLANSIRTRGSRPIFVAFPTMSCPRVDRSTQSLFKCFNRRDVGRNIYDEYWSMLLTREYRNESPVEMPTDENTKKAAANTPNNQQMKQYKDNVLIQHQVSSPLPQQTPMGSIQGLLNMQIHIPQQGATGNIPQSGTQSENGISGLAACIPSALLATNTQQQARQPTSPQNPSTSPQTAPRVHMRDHVSHSDPLLCPNTASMSITWKLDTIEPPTGSIDVGPMKARYSFANCMSELQRAVTAK